jgi:hypothetical protein
MTTVTKQVETWIARTTESTIKRSTTITYEKEAQENTADLTLENTTILSNTVKTPRRENIITSNHLIPSVIVSVLVLASVLLCCYSRARLCYVCNSRKENTENRVDYTNNYMDTAGIPVYVNHDGIRIYDIPYLNDDRSSSNGSWKTSVPPHHDEGDYDDTANVMQAQSMLCI